jgi:DNA recombination protein RmuC
MCILYSGWPRIAALIAEWEGYAGWSRMLAALSHSRSQLNHNRHHQVIQLVIENFVASQDLLHLSIACLLGIVISALIAAFYVRSVRVQARLEVERLHNDWRMEEAGLQRSQQDAEHKLSDLRATHAQDLLRLKEAEQDARRLDSELAAAKATLVSLHKLQEQYETANNEVKLLRERNAQLDTRLEEHQRHRQEEQKLLDEAKNALKAEFEQTANKIFDAKQTQFSTSSKSNLEQVLSPFKQQLGEFHKRVEDIYHKENSQRNQLVGQIAELQKQAQQISNDAVTLAKALKGDNKAQGNWGEIVLERLLEQSGLEKGREYHTQVSLQSVSGKRFQPDVVVRLPDNKDIIIDAKVSLLSYERYYSCEDEQDKQAALKAHIESLRSHIRNLSVKEYEALEGIRTLDFVFIFVPVEAAYLVAMQESPSLFKEAYEKNIVLVSPSSLMVALRTVETIWRHEKQSRNAEKIAVSAGRLYDQFALVSKALDELGGCLNKAQDAYETTWKRLSGGKGNLLRRMEDIRKLGAKTSKTLPDAMRRELDDDYDDEEAEVSEQPVKQLVSEGSR